MTTIQTPEVTLDVDGGAQVTSTTLLARVNPTGLELRGQREWQWVIGWPGNTGPAGEYGVGLWAPADATGLDLLDTLAALLDAFAETAGREWSDNAGLFPLGLPHEVAAEVAALIRSATAAGW